jgi:REP element-mobilizing transposase RayT
MILAHHCIFSMYGFWLPNDPRGSGSDYIAMWELFRFGPATKTTSRRSVAAVSHNWQHRLAAKRAMRYPPVELTGRQAVTVVAGFAMACGEADYRIHACAVLPDHIHLVIGAHWRNIRTIVGHLKGRATRLLKERGQWQSDEQPVWGAHGWNVRLQSLQAVSRAIAYVEQNPIKERKRPQRWSLVTPFDLGASKQAAQLPQAHQRRIGGAALRSSQLARRKRRG